MIWSQNICNQMNILIITEKNQDFISSKHLNIVHNNKTSLTNLTSHGENTVQ